MCVNHSEFDEFLLALRSKAGECEEEAEECWSSQTRGVSLAARDVMYLRSLIAVFMEIGEAQLPAVTVWVDNAGVLI